MKLCKIGGVLLSAVIASAALATTASASLYVPSEKTALLQAGADNWKMSVLSSHNVDYSQIKQVQFVVKLSDESAYLEDKEAGFYSDGETAFLPFQGSVSVGASEWYEFKYDSLDESAESAGYASVTSLGGSTYALTGTFASEVQKGVTPLSVNLAEWGNRSPDYYMEIVSASFLSASGDTIISFDISGNVSVAPDAAYTVTTAATEAPVEETTTTTTTVAETTTTTTVEETTTTTTVEETTTTEETTTVEEETSAETETAEETTTEATTTTKATTTAAETTTATEAAETTTAAVVTKPVAQAQMSSAAVDFSERNGSLTIWAIAAGVVAAVSVVMIAILVIKKK